MKPAVSQSHPRRLSNSITYVKPGGSFVFRYDDSMASVNACMRQLTEFATDPELDFDWSDAAAIARKLKARHA